MGAASGFAWPDGATSAISLTFDGAYPEHFELVAPILAEHDIHGTFFVTVPGLLESPDKWRSLARSGHEIGNHCFYGVTNIGELPAWNLEMIRNELRSTDKGIVEILECPVTSFAMPGASTQCAEGEYAELINRQFSAVRSGQVGSNLGLEVNLSQVACSHWRDLVGPVESLIPEEGQWSVPVFDRFFDLEFGTAEDDLLVLLGHLSRRKNIWIAPFGEVASHIAAVRLATLKSG